MLRQIPLEYVTGILQNIYSVHGGVIREAATGRIVAHLALPVQAAVSGMTASVPGVNAIAGAFQTYQLASLSSNVRQVLTLSLATTAMSGLGLATSLVGFAYLAHRMSAIDKEIAQIKSWLSSASEGQMRAAVSDLSHAARSEDPQTRRPLMLSAKSAFTSLAHHYRVQAAGAKALREFEAFEDLCVTAMLGAVICASNLDLHDAAAEDMRAFHGEWATMARRQLHRLLDLDNAPRLLDGRYVKSLASSDLISLLDFARDEPRGIRWIDELRQNYGTAAAFATGMRQIGDDTLQSAKRLRARNDVLASYCEHFRYLAARRMSARAFDALVDDATSDGRVALLVAAAPDTGPVG